MNIVKMDFITWATDMLCKGNEENEKAVRKRRIPPLLNKCKTWNQELWEYMLDFENPRKKLRIFKKITSLSVKYDKK